MGQKWIRKAGLWVLLVVIVGIICFSPITKDIWRMIRLEICLRGSVYASLSSNKKEFKEKHETFSGKSSELKRTAILPAFESPSLPEKNNIWCSAIQLAWNEMKDTVVKGPIQITGAQEICTLLNSAAQGKADLLPESYYVAAGKVPEELIRKIQADMAQRFPSVTTPLFDSDAPLIAYAYLEAYIQFSKPFFQNRAPLMFKDHSGNTTPVKSFGIRNDCVRGKDQLYKQIEVLYCKLEDFNTMTEYALDLCRDTQPYQIVVAVIEREASLKSTYDKLQEKINGFRNQEDYEKLARFDEYADDLRVPDMFWTINHQFTELNQSGEFYAMQKIDFRLDRCGVVLKAEAALVGAGIARNFFFDKPFLIYLKKRDASQPFFVMWVDNAELLVPFGKN